LHIKATGLMNEYINSSSKCTDVYVLFEPFPQQYPDHGLNRLTERLMLFRHDYNSPNMLSPINAASDVTDGALIEIIVSGLRS
jgi:hypothetical protein